MANTDVTTKQRKPRAPRAVAPKTEELEGQVPEISTEEIEQVTVSQEPEVPTDLEENLEVSQEPEVAQTATEVYLVPKGEKFLVYKNGKRLSRNPVRLEKAELIAAGYGESNPSIR